MKGLLFDMDGVLVDVSQSYRRAIKETVRRLSGRNVSYSLIQKYKNRGGLNNDWDLTDMMLRDMGKKVSKKTVIDTFQRFYKGDDFDGLIRYERWLLSSKSLKALKSRFRLGIVTGRPRQEADYVLRRFDVKVHFAAVITMDDVPHDRQKPDPIGLQMALRSLAVEDSYYIGDCVDDMLAARRAGIAGIGVAEEQDLRELLINSGAQFVLKDVNQIVEVLP